MGVKSHVLFYRNSINMCKPKVREMPRLLKFFTGSNIIGITLAPFGIYLASKYIVNKITVNHEKIHWAQQLEMLIIFFYVWYITEWFIRLFVSKGNAYRSISFEREAYANDANSKYLTIRKHYAWLKYMKVN